MAVSTVLPTGLVSVGLVSAAVSDPGAGDTGARELGLYLTPQIGHNIGFQAPISTKSAWAQSRAWHTARVKWCGAENCGKFGPK